MHATNHSEETQQPRRDTRHKRVCKRSVNWMIVWRREKLKFRGVCEETRRNSSYVSCAFVSLCSLCILCVFCRHIRLSVSLLNKRLMNHGRASKGSPLYSFVVSFLLYFLFFLLLFVQIPPSYCPRYEHPGDTQKDLGMERLLPLVEIDFSCLFFIVLF